MTPDNNKYRIEQLEAQSKKMDESIHLIMTNHLPHINVAIEKLNGTVRETTADLKSRMNYLTITNVSAIILGIVIVKFFQ
jgi:hypothetical protein